jgi:DNA-binding response OmpR family regulator
MSDRAPLVLVVEDERDLADLYATWFGDDYRVETSYGGREALDALDDLGDEVSVILLDRRMPDLSGDEVLEGVRERGVDSRVAMVTAVEPDFDIIEMGFDDYLVKPVTREDLVDTVERMLLRTDYDDGVQELFALASKKALLESEKGPAALEDNEEYGHLDSELGELRDELDRTLETIGERDEIERVYHDIERSMESVDATPDADDATPDVDDATPDADDVSPDPDDDR